MSGVYWGVTAMDLMRKIDMMNKEEIIEFVKSCQHEDGGLGASLNHDSSLLYTLSAIQVNGGGGGGVRGTLTPPANVCITHTFAVHIG